MNILLNNLTEEAESARYVVSRGPKEGARALNRESALQEARSILEEPIWGLMSQLEKTLEGLARTPHFDLADPTAIGAALHSSLPQAAIKADLSSRGLEVASYKDGPCYKIAGKIVINGTERAMSLELHIAGPRGGTSKDCHQFALTGDATAPRFPGFEIAAPDSLLFFLAYHLDATGVAVRKLYLMFADGVDRDRVELHRPEALAAPKTSTPVEPGSGPMGTKVALKKTVVGDTTEDGIETSKRGDAASSS